MTPEDWMPDATLSGHTHGWRERLRDAAGFYRHDTVPACGLTIITAQWGTGFTAVIDAQDTVWLRYYGLSTEVSHGGLLEAHAEVMAYARRWGRGFLPFDDWL